MSNRSTIVALVLLVLLASCACLGAFVSWSLNSAMSQAATLATETTTANSDAHAVSVCVGLINAGSCTARQTSTAVATRPAAARPAVAAVDDLGPNPWPVIIPMSVGLLAVVYVMLRGLDALDGAA